MMKRILVLFLIVSVMFGVVNIAAGNETNTLSKQYGDFTYREAADTVMITGYTGAGGAVTIPDEIGGKPVVSIANFAFSKCTRITSLILSKNVTSIENWALEGCAGLVTIIISSSVTKMEGRVFYSCTGLTDIQVDADNPVFCGDGGVLFNKEKTTIIRYPNAKSSMYTIPDGVISIGDSAFSSCYNLLSVTIASSVKSVEAQAFANCSGLDSITLPNGVKSVGTYAFLGCTALTSITLSSGITDFEYDMFEDCLNLNNIYVDSANPVLSSVNGILFSKDKTEVLRYPFGKNEAYIMPDSVEVISEYAFADCTKLTSITMSNNLTSIKDFAFSGCENLTGIILPDSAVDIGKFAFSGCTNLIEITIPSNVTNIGFEAFDNCTNLKNIKVDDNSLSYSSVDGVLFNKDKTVIMKCSETKKGEYDIPNGVKLIYPGAFSNCIGLASIDIPNSVTNIAESVFFNCTGLSTITIPDSVVYIGADAFAGCDLSKLTIYVAPDSYALSYARQQGYNYIILSSAPVDLAVLPWAASYIQDVIDKGVMFGSYDKGGNWVFRPADSATRAEFSVALFQYLGLEKDANNIFDDTKDHWAKDYIAKLVSLNILFGYSETVFGPDDSITREQIAVMLQRALSNKNLTEDFKYTDDALISEWARPSVYAARSAGWICGDETGAFRPADSAIRAEIAAIFSRLPEKKDLI